MAPNTAPVGGTEIVIPTTASPARARELLRAIASVLGQGARALVVINGALFDPGLKTELEERRDIRTLVLDKPGLPNAIHVGRQAVEAEFFAFLDDDDYLLPGSVAVREAYLRANPDFDAVVTNGLREEWGPGARLYGRPEELDRIRGDLLGSLLEANWMTPCGALYRSATVPADIFRDLARYAEWTDVAYRLVDEYRLGFLFDETFVQTDTPGSLSKHGGQARSLLELHGRMATKLRTKAQRRRWNDRVSRLHHEIAEEERLKHNRGEALRHHVRSLFHAPSIGIPRYLAYTLTLLRGA